MKYNELTDEQKQKAISRMRDINVDHDWYESCYDTIVEGGKLLGFDIKVKGFSLDYGRGDYIELSGTYRYKPGCIEATKDWPALRLIAHGLVRVQCEHFYKLEASLNPSRYRPKGTSFTVYKNGHEYDDSALGTVLRDFEEWAFRLLYEEYEWMTSDEAIIEAIEANEYEFTVADRNTIIL